MNPFDTTTQWAWLATDAGAQILAEAEALPADRLTRLTRLRRICSTERATAVVELLELRHRARAKFSRANTMFFTPEGLEQSTGEAIATYRASRFLPGMPVLDTCCGIGGDAMALARTAPVFAVDRNPGAALCTHLNVQGTAQRFPVKALCADVTTLDLGRLSAAGFGAAYFDPSRRADSEGGRRRVRHAEDYAPPLHWLEALRARFAALAVKVAPSIDDNLLHRSDARVEFLSDRGECKEAVLWFGPLTEALPSADRVAGEEGYYATVLRPGQLPATLAPFPCDPIRLSTPMTWLYEPDPAVIRSHRLPQIAALLGARQLDSQIAYLTADNAISTPFATAYRVLDWLPFHLKNIQARLRELNRHVVAIKRRGVPLEPEELRKRLTGTGHTGDPPAVVVLGRMAEKPVAILCEPAELRSP